MDNNLCWRDDNAATMPAPVQAAPPTPRCGLMTARRGRAALALLAGVLVVSIGLFIFAEIGARPPTPSPAATVAAFETMVAATRAAAQTGASPAALITATAAGVASQPYVAPRPGPCDLGDASWQIFDRDHNDSPYQFPGIVSCTAESMRIDGNAAVYCYSIGHVLPIRYRASVDVTPAGTEDPALGVELGPSSRSNSIQYALSVEANGSWYTRYGNFSPGGNMTIHSGKVTAAARYALILTVRDSYATFSINGAEVEQHQQTSATMISNGIFMAVAAQDGDADFSTFVITPLS